MTLRAAGEAEGQRLIASSEPIAIACPSEGSAMDGPNEIAILGHSVPCVCGTVSDGRCVILCHFCSVGRRRDGLGGTGSRSMFHFVSFWTTQDSWEATGFGVSGGMGVGYRDLLGLCGHWSMEHSGTRMHARISRLPDALEVAPDREGDTVSRESARNRTSWMLFGCERAQASGDLNAEGSPRSQVGIILRGLTGCKRNLRRLTSIGVRKREGLEACEEVESALRRGLTSGQDGS